MKLHTAAIDSNNEQIYKHLMLVLCLWLISAVGMGQSITVTSPSGGDMYAPGETMNITWNDDYNPDNVGINLLDSGGNVAEVITEYTSNTGSYSWTIPSGIAEGSYQIEVYEAFEICMGDPGCGNYARGDVDDQSGTFSIEEPDITFSSGYDGSDVVAGEDFYFDWTDNITSGQLELHYEHPLEGWKGIATLSSSASSYTWNTPNQIISDFRIRIRSTAYSGTVDYINNVSLIKDIEVTSPVSSTSLSGGDDLNISWDANYGSGSIRIDLYKGGSHQQALTTSTSNDGSWSWSIPRDIATGSDYQIRVKDTDSSTEDYSANFSLTKASISVSSPSSSTSQVGGSNLTINWSTSYSGGNVQIDLYKGGSLDQSVISSTANDGDYSWKVPKTITTGSDYQIRVKDTESSVNDLSSNFTLNQSSITVTDPSAGQEFIVGNVMDISWTDNYDLDYVGIDLLNSDGSVNQTLVGETTNDGSHSWSIPSDLSPGDYMIEIYEMELVPCQDAPCYTRGAIDDQTGTFSIEEPDITFSSGYDGSDVVAGDDFYFDWTDNITSGQLELHYEHPLEGWKGIATLSSSASSYTWNTPNQIISDFRIRIRSTAHSGTVDYINNVSLIKDLEVTSPISSTSKTGGETLDVQWNANYSYGTVRVDLYKGGRHQQTLTSSTDNDGAWGWDIPEDIAQGSDYQVRVKDSNGDTEDYSSNFTLSPASAILANAREVVSFDDYDQWGNVLRATDANGAVTAHYYGTNAQPFSQDASNGHYLTGVQRLVGSDDCSGDCGGRPSGDDHFVEARYDDYGRMTQMIDENESSAFFGYDNLHRLNKVQNNNSFPVSEYTYVLPGSSFSGTNPNYIETRSHTGRDTRYSTEYIDGLGRPVQTQQRDGTHDIVSTIEYDGAGREWRTWKPYRWDTGHSYDPDWAVNDTTYYRDNATYDSYRFPFAEQQYEESPLERVVRIIPEGGAAESGYDSTAYRLDTWNGHTYQVVTQVDPEGNTTETWTDGWGRTVRTVADPNGIAAETIFEYDELANLTKVINVVDPDNIETAYHYDTRGNLIRKTSPDAGTVRHKYDNAGNLRFSQDANRSAAGEVVFTSYDALGRPTAEGIASADFSSLDGEVTEPFESNTGNWKGAWAYEANPDTSEFPWSNFDTKIDGESIDSTKGQLTARAWKAGDGSSSQIGANPWQMELYSYDDEGRVKEKWIWTGDKSSWDTHLSYEYNRQGEVTKRQITVGSQTLYQFYEYNQRGLLSKVFVNTADSKPSSSNYEATYTYTATGAIDNINYKGSKDVDYGYTIRDWVKNINDVGSPNGNFAAKYNYADNGNVSKAQFHNPQNQISGHDHYHQDFSYDNLNRLTGADYGDGSSGSSTYFDVAGLNYDEAGNITGLQRNDETGSLIDDLGYSYQSGSNRLGSISDAAGQPTSWDAADATFEYDANGNLTSQSGKLDDVAYDHRNLPTQFELTSGDTVIANYNADGQRILKESSGGAWQFYVMDGEQTLAVIKDGNLSHINLVGNSTFGRWEPGGAWRYYISDHLGSTRAVVDDGGNVLETFDYYPGGLHMPQRTSTTGNTIEKFTGKERDESLGLDYFGARYYDPATLRWGSVDPRADDYPSWSPYNYTLGDPVNKIDPNGECVIPSDPFCLGLHEGFRNTVTSTLEGIGNLFSDPVGTAKGIGNALANPGETFDAITAGVGERVDMATSGNLFEMGQVAGESIALVGEVLVGTKGAGSLAKGTKLLKTVDKVNNPVPKNLARVVDGDVSNLTTLGRQGASDVFVTGASDIRGLNAAGLSNKLTIPQSGSFTVIEFPTSSIKGGIASPIRRSNPGFVGRGLTKGGAREFVVPNQPIPANAKIRKVQQ